MEIIRFCYWKYFKCILVELENWRFKREKLANKQSECIEINFKTNSVQCNSIEITKTVKPVKKRSAFYLNAQIEWNAGKN